MQENLIIIFARNPKLGKVKTRLAASIGDKMALKTYTLLLEHTAKVTHQVKCDKMVFYSENIEKNDLWIPYKFMKYKQADGDLGQRMAHAFNHAFAVGYRKVILIGSDAYSLQSKHLETAFNALQNHDVVLGPATDGGYYLLGLKTIIPSIFKNKKWSESSVLEATLGDLKKFNIHLIEPLNDIDTFEDLKKEPQLLKQLNIHD